MTGTDDIGSNSAEDERRLEALIRLQTETLPVEIHERLAEMRRQAVAAAESENASRLLRLTDWLMNGSVSWRGLTLAGSTGAVMLSIWLVSSSGSDLLEIPLISESEVVLVQDLALLEELEFAAWLEEDGFEDGGLDEEAPGAG